MADRDEIFKKLIQRSEPEKTSSDFTGKVIKLVEAEERVRDAAFRKVMMTIPADETSLSFESKVMAQIAPVARMVEKPIISKSVWYTVAAFFVVVIGYSLFANSAQVAQDVNPYAYEAGKAILVFSAHVVEIPILYPVVITSLCVLLLADYFILQRFTKRTFQ